jgi:hypothetical protein
MRLASNENSNQFLDLSREMSIFGPNPACLFSFATHNRAHVGKRSQSAKHEQTKITRSGSRCDSGKHYSIRTEQSYVDWIKRFIIYHDKRHPSDMTEEEAAQFLTHLARDLNVAPST